MKYYIIAGESSGDLHGSNLMKEIRARDPQAEFRCWGGDRMQKQGGVIVKHYRDLAFMGFIRVILNLRTILGNIKFCKEDILQYKPDAVILVDYPGFNLREYVDQMFVILPFEKDFYKKFDVEVDFVGHPLLDAIPTREECMAKDQFIREHELDDRPIIAMLPGSRKQEIGTILKVMLEMVPAFDQYQFVIAGESSIHGDYYNRIIGAAKVPIVYGKLADLLYSSEAALVTSGTATLETALIGTPEVVCYKAATISYLIAKMIVDVKHISLVNLVMDKAIVKELVQFDFTVKNLKKELDQILSDQEYREKMIKNYADLNERLGGPGASAKAAELMMNTLGT